MLLVSHEGQYSFLPGIDAYSSGVVAAPGYEVVHATLHAPVPYREGFDLIARHLRAASRSRATLCAIELRIPEPLSFDGFAGFNVGYRAILADWGLLVDGRNPIARTNVAPLVAGPSSPSLYGFSYTMPAVAAGPATFVVAGSGELRPGTRAAEGIVRNGETSPEAIRDKAAFVMSVMQARLTALGGHWSQITAIDVYTAHAVDPVLAGAILAPMGAAAVHGVRWFPSRPPIVGLEFEMDLRGVHQEVRV